MKKLLIFVLIVGFANLSFAFSKDSIYEEENIVFEEGKTTSEIEIIHGESAHKKVTDSEQNQSDKSLKKQAEKIPVVFAQWWFWVGLIAIIVVMKIFLFKK